jgi:hypothetical protein
MTSFAKKLDRLIAERARSDADPLREKVQATMRDRDAIGTAPLLDLLNMRNTTGNARRISQTMRALGFVPIKSRRLEPGGYRDTVTRGWTRPVRELKRPVLNQKATAGVACVISGG